MSRRESAHYFAATVRLTMRPFVVSAFAFLLSIALVEAPAHADFTENFDEVTPPALPAGWTATDPLISAPAWVTTMLTSDSAPNNAFVNDASMVSDQRLDSPPIPIATPTAVLTFRNNYNLESGQHGGVLEISIDGIDGGAFHDILTAGGSFVGGGYNGTLIAALGNPIDGRMAWSGSSSGYITTTVNLPSAAAGKHIVLRFRFGSDNQAGVGGWHIDTIRIQSQDRDGDFVVDSLDNCPGTGNPGQEDEDGDGKGDICDNCPSLFNADQSDADADGVGDACAPLAPPPDAACGSCAPGVLPMALLSLGLIATVRGRGLDRGKHLIGHSSCT